MDMNLYHASQQKDLKLLRPQRTLSHDKYIGDFIFATANKKLAIMYLAPKGFATLMNSDEKNANIVICAEQEEFFKQDKGGAIYKLSSKDFIESPQKELSTYEMASRCSVKPKDKEVFDSTLGALISSGIEVRFTTKVAFDRLIHSPNQNKMVKSLDLYS